MSEPLTSEDSKKLLELCRAGKLYEVERWIESGKSIRTSPGIRRTPLDVAIDLGFHSLIELLIRHERDQETKNKTLSDAVAKKRLDLIELLAANGAQITSLPLAEVLLTWEPAITGFFLEHGADVVTGSPFAVAFGEKVRTALRPYVDYKKAHPELAQEMQEQADRALRHFASEGNLKWISLMMWAGADPRSRGPSIDDRYSDDSECHTTALQAACYKGTLDVLKKLRPDASRDDLSELLRCASLFGSREIVRYLLEMGADPNDKANGGSSSLDGRLRHLAFEDYRASINKQLISKYAVREAMECLQELVEHGALWKPEDGRELNSIRQTLFKCEPVVTVEVVKLFARNKTCAEETLEELLNAPRMRQHLSSLGMKFHLDRGPRRKSPAKH